MMDSPRITIYIASHNYGKYLSEAIESVLRQSVDDWELIIIDDNSTDNTPEIMQRYKGHPQISLFRTESIGLPAVSNYALSKARGRYVIRLDGDDVFDENILLVLGNYLDKHSEIALVFPDYYLVDIYGDVYSHERRRIHNGNSRMDLPPNGACTLVRKDVLASVGGYREDLGAQDGFDLWTKIMDGYKTAHVNTPLFYYRRHGENLTTNIQRIVSARREIKMDAIRDKLEELRPIVAVIPCRRNFDFISDLWKVELNGDSLLQRDIGACLTSKLFDHIVVTCDNPEAEDILKKYDDPRLRFVLRDPKETVRTESIGPTLERVVKEVDPYFSGVTVMRYIQTPFVTTETLEEAVSTLAFSDASSAFAVEEIHSPLYQRTPHGFNRIGRRGELSSDFDTVYRDPKTCQVIRNKNLRNGSLTGAALASFVVSPAECFFIGSERDLLMARLMLEGLS